MNKCFCNPPKKSTEYVFVTQKLIHRTSYIWMSAGDNMSRRRRDENRNGGRNLKMNDEVYALRRKVMDIVYEVKEVKDMPRVTVRITEKNPCGALGFARMGANILWIPETTVKMTKDELRNVVIHEIGHAVFNLDHDKNCGIMCACLCKILSKDECLEIVKGW